MIEWVAISIIWLGILILIGVGFAVALAEGHSH